MRTTITLDRAILGVLQKETGLSSKSKAVLVAVKDYIRRRRLNKLLSKCGTYQFHPKTAEWRHIER